MVEVFFGTGIPLVGFVCAARNSRALEDLLWFYPLLLLVGWHVVEVNDICFDRKNFRFSVRHVIPLLIVPFILACGFFLKPVFIAVIFLIILNWNVYSFYGKYNWMTGLFYNFSGGILHFLAGVTATGCTDLFPYYTESLFFGFAMLSGAIHHDTSHLSEDLNRHYRTGAVIFGEFIWWRLGIVPMLTGIMIMLCSKDMLFVFCFCISSTVYLALYFLTTTWKINNYMLYFRILCRLAFAAGATAYIVLRLLKMG